METWTVEKLLQTASAYLRQKGSSSPRLDAELLLAKTLGCDRVKLYTEFDRPLETSAVDHFRSLIARRAAHEPVAYILGQAYFRHLCLTVDRSVLIPRPETEELVELALETLRRRPAWAGLGEAATVELVADVGTGSGAIALSIAQEAGLHVLATDTSRAALDVAAANAEAVGVRGLVELREADLLEGVPDHSLHLVVSNPPYVTSADFKTLAPDVRLYEPAAALDAGPDGLDVVRRLLPEAARALRPGGTVLVEMGYDQAAAVSALALQAGFAFTQVHKDLSRKDRMLEASLPGVFAVPIVPAAPERPVAATTTAAATAATTAFIPALTERETAALHGALRAGAIVGVPTDTVYGLVAHWDSNAGVRRLFAAKGRPATQPVQVLFPSVGAITAALPDLDPAALKVLESLLPGPYTFIVATARPRLGLVGTPDSLGVRVPAHPPLLGLLEHLDLPLAATSANPSGATDAASLADVDPAVLAHCSVAFDDAGAKIPRGKASTVVDLRPLARGEKALVLREGAVPAAEVLARICALV